MFSNIGIVTNTLRDPDFSKTLKLTEILKYHGLKVMPETNLQDMLDEADLIITLGGDGTILSVAEDAAVKGVPVLGINIGYMGYLTDSSFNMAEQSIINLANNKYVIEDRMMLKVRIKSEEGEIRCLNDIAISKGQTSKIIRLDLLINDSFFVNYNADGIIVCTPTGSTAYNLSAGGPILNPNSEMIAITPICPHMLTCRPFVVSSNDKITIRVGDIKNETIAMPDGKDPITLETGDIVSIEKSESYAKILKTNGMNFYEILRKKLLY